MILGWHNIMQCRKKILVTRPVHQSDLLCYMIEQQGWQAIHYPVIEIQARELSARDQMHIHNIQQYQYLFFVSANAVNFALPLINGKMETLQKKSCIAVGKATFKALANCGIESALIPANSYNSESILAKPELQSLAGFSCLIIRGEGGRELLAQTLLERGAKVDYLEVYKRVIPCHDNSEVEAYIFNKSLAAIVIYSGDALHNLIKMLAKQDIIKNLLNVPLVVISERVKTIAEKIGFNKIIVADQASDSAMINALLNGEECG